MSQHDKNHSAERRPTKDARRRMSAYRKGVEAGRAEALAGVESRLERLELLVRTMVPMVEDSDEPVGDLEYICDACSSPGYGPEARCGCVTIKATDQAGDSLASRNHADKERYDGID